MNLEQTIRHHFKDLTAAGSRPRTTILAAPESKGFPKVKQKLRSKLQKALRSYNSNGDIGRFSTTVKSQLSDAYKSAYQLGVGDKDLSTREKKFVDAVQADQFSYLDKFLSDLDAGEGKMDYGQRLDMYVEKVDSVYWSGAVKALDDDVEIYWNLMPGESCEDCIELADDSPYAPDELPTTPRAGETDCLGNCNCSLTTEHNEAE